MSRIIVFREGTIDGAIDLYHAWPEQPSGIDLCPQDSYYWHTGDWFIGNLDAYGSFAPHHILDHSQIPADLRAYVLLAGTMR